MVRLALSPIPSSGVLLPSPAGLGVPSLPSSAVLSPPMGGDGAAAAARTVNDASGVKGMKAEAMPPEQSDGMARNRWRCPCGD